MNYIFIIIYLIYTSPYFNVLRLLEIYAVKGRFSTVHIVCTPKVIKIMMHHKINIETDNIIIYYKTITIKQMVA